MKIAEQLMLFKGTSKFSIVELENKMNLRSGQLSNYLGALSLNRELSRYGYTLSLEGIEQASRLTNESLTILKNQMIEVLEDKTGASDFQNSEPFYRNFPEEVMSKTEAELYFNSIMYYTFSQTNNPEMTSIANQIREFLTDQNSVERELLPASEFNALKVIEPADYYELEEMLYKRTQALNMSEAMYDEMKTYAAIHPKEWVDRIFEGKQIDCPSHETKAKLALIAHNDKDQLTLHKLCPNAEDVLRFAVILSKENDPKRDYLNANLDFNIKNNKKIFKLSKADQREIKMLLENCNDLFTSIWHREALFNRLKERINANDNRYLRVKKAFDNLSNGIRQDEFGIDIKKDNINNLKKEIEKGNYTEILEFAKRNPKVFMRNLVSIAETAEKIPAYIDISLFGPDKCMTEAIKIAAKEVPVIQTLHLIKYLENTQDVKDRPFNIQTVKGKNYIFKNDMYLSDKMRRTIMNQLELSAREKTAASHSNSFDGKNIYIDPELRNRKAPERSIRNASKGATLVPYSKIPAREDKNIIAFGIYWANKDNERADIDLSVALFDKNGNSKDYIYYGNLKGDLHVGVHSGDYVSGQTSDEINGAVEYIFLDKELLKKNGIKQVVSTVHGFNVPFCDADSVRVMVAEKSGSLDDVNSQKTHAYSSDPAPRFKGKLMDPREMHYSYRLTQNATIATNFIYDVDANEFISLDTTKGVNLGTNIAMTTMESLENNPVAADMYKAYHNDVPSMYEVFATTALGCNCSITEDITQADIIFTAEAIDAKKLGCKEHAAVINSYELDKISASFCDPHGEVITGEAINDHTFEWHGKIVVGDGIMPEEAIDECNDLSQEDFDITEE